MTEPTHVPAQPPHPAAKKPLPWWLIVAIVAAIVGGGYGLYDAYIKDHLFPKRWGEVVPGAIYRSGQLPPHLVRKMIERHDLQWIVDLTSGVPEYGAREVEICRAQGVKHVRFPLGGDGAGDIGMYASAIKNMHDAAQAGQPLLVHCAAGAQRTGGVTACYRMLVQGWTGQQAQDEMRRYDWHEDDRGVVEYVNANIGELARMLVDLGVIERVPDPLPHLPEPWR